MKKGILLMSTLLIGAVLLAGCMSSRFEEVSYGGDHQSPNDPYVNDVNEEVAASNQNILEGTAEGTMEKAVVDETGYAFEMDEQVIGVWTAVDFVREKNDFEPGQVFWSEPLDLVMVFYEDGTTNHAYTWTKGHVLSTDTDELYEIVTMDGKEYMFMEWKSGDYTFLGRKPAYYVLERTSTYAEKPAQSYVDDVDYPFVADEQLLGKWRSVDFVEDPETFDPEQREILISLPLEGMQFIELGIVQERWEDNNWNDAPYYRWTKGHLLHVFGQMDMAYHIEEIGGKDYLLFPWKTGDYMRAGKVHGWYVFERDDSE